MGMDPTIRLIMLPLGLDGNEAVDVMYFKASSRGTVELSIVNARKLKTRRQYGTQLLLSTSHAELMKKRIMHIALESWLLVIIIFEPCRLRWNNVSTVHLQLIRFLRHNNVREVSQSFAFVKMFSSLAQSSTTHFW
jgi:hypothetical protein